MPVNKYVLKIKNMDKNFLFFAGIFVACLIMWIVGVALKILVMNFSSALWYSYLFKPALNLPILAFQAFQGIISAIAVISLYFALDIDNIFKEKLCLFFNKIKLLPTPETLQGNPKAVRFLIFIYIVLNNLFLPLFFGFKSVTIALILALMLVLLGFAALIQLYKLNPFSGIIFVPCLIWSAYLVGIYATFFVLNNTQWVMWSFNHGLI